MLEPRCGANGRKETRGVGKKVGKKVEKNVGKIIDFGGGEGVYS